TNPDRPFCPVNEWVDKDPTTGKIRSYHIDECYVPTHEKDIQQKEIEMNILIPKIDYSCNQFLNIYYNIYSFDDALNWLTESKTVLLTKMRIIECAWETYGSTIELIDNRLVDFYIEVIKKKW